MDIFENMIETRIENDVINYVENDMSTRIHTYLGGSNTNISVNAIRYVIHGAVFLFWISPHYFRT